MLEVAGINIWAILLTWFLYLAVGAFWYSPAGFAKQWTKHTGVDILKIPEGQATKILAFVALSGLVQVLALALVLNSLNVTEVWYGLLVAFVLWLGFVAATTVGTTLYQQRSWAFLWLNSSYFLVVMAVGSLILTVWR